MGQALYRKHRPKKLAEVVGQEHITKTLAEALKQGRISHAYLFTGPRGVGKTSIARILAHEINGLAYEDDSSHIDIIEIDAASNRRIDEIRELREKVHVAPTSARYKVYIIDEVHMLTREAFNALLKTLEEPPTHVVFILATTDAHKLPDTIISRTQRFSFKPVARKEVAEHLAGLAKLEKIKVSPEALRLLAEHGEGSFRDSISLLDQASSHGRKIELADVRQLLGLPPSEAVEGVLQSVYGQAGAAEVLSDLNTLYDQGYQAAAIAKQISQHIRLQLIDNQLTLQEHDALRLLDRLLQVPIARDPERFLEIVLLDTIALTKKTNLHDVSETKVKKIEKNVSSSPEHPKSSKQVGASVSKTHAPKTRDNPDESEQQSSVNEPLSDETDALNEPFDEAVWPEVLSALKQRHNTLYGVVRMAEPKFQADGTIELAVAFAFHQKRLTESGNRQKLVETIHELTGRQVRIECILSASVTAPAIQAAPKNESSEDLAAISNIFGGGELLES